VNGVSFALRGALWLYFLAFAGIAVLRFALTALDLGLVLLLGAVFIIGGLLLCVGILTGVRPAEIAGQRPRLLLLAVAMVAGAALWLPTWWLLVVTNSTLNTVIGRFPVPSIAAGLDRAAYVVLFGVMVPLLYSLLFFGLLQRMIVPRAGLGGVLIVGALFGLFALISTEFALSGVVAYFLIGFVASLAAYFTRSIWCGAGVLIGYSLVRPLIDRTRAGASLQAFLFPAGIAPDAALFAGRFLLLVIVGIFVAFVCLQVLRLSSESIATTEQAAGKLGSERRRWWWLPLVLTGVLVVVLVWGEIGLRLALPVSGGGLPTLAP
jgi:hypothetical protein